MQGPQNRPQGPVTRSQASVIDLTNEPPDGGDDIQRAIAASLQDSQGILGGQVSRDDQDISRWVH